MIPGGGRFYPRSAYQGQLQYYASQFEPPNSMACSIERPRRMPSKAGGTRPARTLSSHGRHRNSSPTGSGCRTNSVNSLELMESRLSLSGDKAGSGSVSTATQLPGRCRSAFLFSPHAFARNAVTASNFAIPVGIRHGSFACSRSENISLCISDHHDAPAPWKRTADFVYVRGHGPGGRYKGHYSTDALADWAKRIRSWKAQGCDVFVFFDNDQKSAAPIDALKLKQMLAKRKTEGRSCMLSLLAAALTSPSSIPQVKKALPAGSTEDLSSKRFRRSRLD